MNMIGKKLTNCIRLWGYLHSDQSFVLFHMNRGFLQRLAAYNMHDDTDAHCLLYTFAVYI